MVVLLVLLALALSAGATMLATRLGTARFCPRATTFACRVRAVNRPGDHRPDHRPARWPRRRWRGAWAHDVLLLKRGALLPRVTALTVRMPEDALRDAWPRELRGLGHDPVVVLLRLDDDSLVEVGAAREHRADLVGPFMAAVIPGLPRGRPERPHPGPLAAPPSPRRTSSPTGEQIDE